MLSQWVNVLIQSPVVGDMLKWGARTLMITNAEKKGIPWTNTAEELAGQQSVYELMEEVDGDAGHGHQWSDGSFGRYPAYYTQPFHAYEDGNLCWKAAFEVESATYVMATRVFPDEKDLPWQIAQQRLRDGYTGNVKRYASEVASSSASPEVHPWHAKDVLDSGCSVGISTIALAAAFPQANVTGLDLSPYFIAVAQLRGKQDTGARWKPDGFTDEINARIRWVCANAEDTPFEDASFDLVSLAFVTHELPQRATQRMFDEAFRLLRPGGILCMCDNDPQSKVIRNLPAPIFTLMKATEPWSDEYYTMDIAGAMASSGFVRVESTLMDPRHRIVMATKPATALQDGAQE